MNFLTHLDGGAILLLIVCALVIVLAVVYIHQEKKSWPGYDLEDVIRKAREKADANA